MTIYSYSEARQKLAAVPDEAEMTGKVLIRRKDGHTFALRPEKESASPLDVPSIETRVSTAELVALVRRERAKGLRRTLKRTRPSTR